MTDDTFQFFKLLLLKAKLLQNLKSIQIDPQSVFMHTVNSLNQDVELMSAWFNLFAPAENLNEQCECIDPAESEEISGKELIFLEMEQTLIMDLYEGVVRYFCKVHCAEKVAQLKDYVLQKPKTFQLRHTLDVNPNRDKQQIIQFPCGICGKECIDIIHKKKAAFEDFSVQCDKCNKWFHYICANLSGNEPALKENSEIPYYCVSCSEGVDAVADNVENMDIGTQSSETEEAAGKNLSEIDNTAEVPGRGRGHGRGRGRGRGRGTGRGSGRGRGRGRGETLQGQTETDSDVGVTSQPSTSTENYTSVSSRGRKRKAVKRDDFVT